VLRIDAIADLDTAKQVATLLEKENARLHTRLKQLLSEIARLRGEDGQKQLELEVMKLQEQMALLQHRLYGASSEKRATKDDGASNDEPKQPKTGHGPRAQAALPIIEEEHALDEADQVCVSCGGGLVEWKGQSEDADEVDVVERHFVIKRHKRKKYRCQCGAAPETALGPLKLVAGGRYSIEFAVEVATAKYLDHLPLERQARIMGREGLVVDSQTLWDQIELCARHVQASYDGLLAHLHQKEMLHADETPWYLLKGKPAKRWYVWMVASTDAAYYHLDPTRSTDAARQILDNYRGRLMVDGYSVYQSLARGSPGKPSDLVLGFCWSHVRREYVEAERFYPQCKEVLDLIGDLYAVERSVPDPDRLNGDARQDALALRKKVRDAESRPLVEKIDQWARRQSALPESKLRKAIAYMMGLWPGLIRFVDDPLLPLHNNLAERELRGVVVGRKNHYGSKSQRGTEVASIFYSLLHSAHLCGIEPKAYLAEATRRAIRTPGTVTLPHDLR
jgi:transposase